MGAGGGILRYYGASWTQASSPTGELLNGVSFATPERGIAVGYQGTSLRYRRAYFSEGTFVSSAHDGGAGQAWATLSWTAAAGAGAEVKFQLAAADSADAATDFRGPDGSASAYYTVSDSAIWAGHAGKRYLRFKAFLSTGDPIRTPLLQDVTVAY